MILVSGATGNVGGALVERLADAGRPVRALVRRPGAVRFAAGVDVVRGDLASLEGLGPALEGVSGLFLLGGFDTLDAVLARARAAGVTRVVLLTSRCVVGGAPDNPITATWLRAEESLRRSGLPGTVLRPAGFGSNLLRWADQLRIGDVVRAPWPDAAIAVIDPADIAAVAAVTLIETGYLGRALDLSGPAALTPAQQVATLARALSRPLRYVPQPEAQARAQMAESMPEAFVDAQFRFFARGEFDDSRVVGTVRRLTGRPAASLQSWAVRNRQAFARAVS
jgi:uncharacterized protein YbjT (DUF2867 family)